MEKLQAALARAREKRDNDGRPVRRTEPVSRMGSRRAARENEIAERWQSLAVMEPEAARLSKSRIYSGKASSEGQYFDILRTKLLLEMRKNDWTRIAITSPTPACGKTTLACNLIAGLGRQHEIRGMLFDLDLRRPIYKDTAAYGHFGRTDIDAPWEKTDKADALRKAAGL